MVDDADVDGNSTEHGSTSEQREQPASRCPVWLQPCVIALQFMTRIPMPDIGIVAPVIMGRSLLYYPLVGLVIGFILWGMQWLLAGLMPQAWGVQAAILLTLWCLLTGGLHLDGLADSADAWIGGFGDRERTLALMKDPTCGPSAVMILVLVLLLKYAALQQLLSHSPYWLIVLPVLARGSVLLLFLTTPYVRKGGLASILVEHFPRSATRVLLLIMALLLLLLGLPGIVLGGVSLGSFVALRWLMMDRLGGATGDTAGALVELLEAVLLVTVVCFYS